MVRTIRIHSRRLMIEMKEISQFAFKIQTMYHELLSQSDISVGSLKVVVMKQTKSSKTVICGVDLKCIDICNREFTFAI